MVTTGIPSASCGRWASPYRLSGGSRPPRPIGKQVDDHVGDMLPVHNGIPQGSPVSPIILVLYSAGVIQDVREAIDLTTSFGIPLLPQSRIDDFAIYQGGLG